MRPSDAYLSTYVDSQIALRLTGIFRCPETTCKTPVEENVALGFKLNVTGTPGVFFADGSRLSGAADAAAIEQKLADVAKK